MPEMATEAGKDRVHTETTDSVVILMSQSDKNQDRLLLVQQRDGTWGPPAGGHKWIEKDTRLETDREAALREIKEETGIEFPFSGNGRELSTLGIKGTIHLQDKDNQFRYRRGIIFFGDLPTNVDIKLEPQDPDIKQAKFFTYQEVLELMLEDNIYKPHFNIGLLTLWVMTIGMDKYTEFFPELETEMIMDYASYWEKELKPKLLAASAVK